MNLFFNLFNIYNYYKRIFIILFFGFLNTYLYLFFDCILYLILFTYLYLFFYLLFLFLFIFKFYLFYISFYLYFFGIFQEIYIIKDHINSRTWRPDWSLLIQIIFEIVNGLWYLHKNSIIHRDLKPDNVLLISTKLDDPVHCKLIDFGKRIFFEFS